MRLRGARSRRRPERSRRTETTEARATTEIGAPAGLMDARQVRDPTLWPCGIGGTRSWGRAFASIDPAGRRLMARWPSSAATGLHHHRTLIFQNTGPVRTNFLLARHGAKARFSNPERERAMLKLLVLPAYARFGVRTNWDRVGEVGWRNRNRVQAQTHGECDRWQQIDSGPVDRAALGRASWVGAAPAPIPLAALKFAARRKLANGKGVER